MSNLHTMGPLNNMLVEDRMGCARGHLDPRPRTDVHYLVLLLLLEHDHYELQTNGCSDRCTIK
jgi:hypothetical protein